MNKKNLLAGSLVAAVAAVALWQASASAQQSAQEDVWEVIVTPYSGDDAYVLVVKHNISTGQTLMLSCKKECGDREEWHDYQMALE